MLNLITIVSMYFSSIEAFPCFLESIPPYCLSGQEFCALCSPRLVSICTDLNKCNKMTF